MDALLLPVPPPLNTLAALAAVEVDRPRRTKGEAGETPAATLAKRREQRLARLDKWAKETTDEVESNFAKLRKFQTDVAAQPKARKVWA